MAQSRQLAAIMFTDIVGYTALMGNDEQAAFDLLNKNREIQKPFIEKFNGKWIKEIGDGILASFLAVSDAVLCAIEIQQACDKTPGLQLRIGIHLGEVVFEDNDVYGDGVNIASRLQASAPIRGIWVSETVHNNVVNKKGIKTRFVKQETLKNVKEPIKIYEINFKDSENAAGQDSFPPKIHERKKTGWLNPPIISLGTLVTLIIGYFIYNSIFHKPGNGAIGSNGAGIIEKSIAVLPFVNMSKDQDQEYFSDGLSEELLHLLAKIPELKVIGRTSSFSFKGKNEDLRMIGEKLGVANLLEGSVQKEGNSIRVTAQLIRAADGSELWSERYERDLKGIFKLQDDIAGAVVKQLKLKLLSVSANPGSSSTNTEVYNLILQGNYFAEKRDKENLAKALDFYLMALALDSLNARSWAALAKCYSLQSNWDRTDWTQGFEKARIAASRSIALDSDQAEAHYVLGVVKMHDFDWDEAFVQHNKALSIEPGNTDFLRSMGNLYRCIGRFDSGILWTKQALALDPVKPISYYSLGTVLHYANQPEKSILSFKKTLELNPMFPRAHTFLGTIYLLQQKPELALDQMTQQSDEAWKSFGLILTYHALGRKKEADKLMKDFIVKFPKNEFFQIAEIYAFRGEKDKAFEYLEKSYADREARLTYFKGDPLLKNLERDPRHTAFLKKMNLPLN